MPRLVIVPIEYIPMGKVFRWNKQMFRKIPGHLKSSHAGIPLNSGHVYPNCRFIIQPGVLVITDKRNVLENKHEFIVEEL